MPHAQSRFGAVLVSAAALSVSAFECFSESPRCADFNKTIHRGPSLATCGRRSARIWAKAGALIRRHNE